MSESFGGFIILLKGKIDQEFPWRTRTVMRTRFLFKNIDYFSGKDIHEELQLLRIFVSLLHAFQWKWPILPGHYLCHPYSTIYFVILYIRCNSPFSSSSSTRGERADLMWPCVYLPVVEMNVVAVGIPGATTTCKLYRLLLGLLEVEACG